MAAVHLKCASSDAAMSVIGMPRLVSRVQCPGVRTRDQLRAVVAVRVRLTPARARFIDPDSALTSFLCHADDFRDTSRNGCHCLPGVARVRMPQCLLSTRNGSCFGCRVVACGCIDRSPIGGESRCEVTGFGSSLSVAGGMVSVLAGSEFA